MTIEFKSQKPAHFGQIKTCGYGPNLQTYLSTSLLFNTLNTRLTYERFCWKEGLSASSFQYLLLAHGSYTAGQQQRDYS